MPVWRDYILHYSIPDALADIRTHSTPNNTTHIASDALADTRSHSISDGNFASNT